MRSGHRPLVIALLSLLAACTSGSSNPVCDNTTGIGQQPATSAWPQFRHDNYNTGRAGVVLTPVGIPPATPTRRLFFSTTGGSRGFASTAAISADGQHVYIGSLDGTLFALSVDDMGTPDATFAGNFAAAFPNVGPIIGAPALDNNGNIYVATEGQLLVVEPNGTALLSVSLGGLGSAPMLAVDLPGQTGLGGTVYVGVQTSASSGFLPAVCANGIDRWAFLPDPIAATPALGPDTTVYFTSSSSLHPYLRAIDPITARPKWTFAAAQPFVTPPVLVVDETTSPATVNTIYVATVAGGTDGAGRLFAVNPATGTPINVPAGCSGSSCKPFSFPVSVGADIVAAPALGFATSMGVETVYVAATDGMLYAVKTSDGSLRAMFETEGAKASPPLGIQSSPLVAKVHTPRGDVTAVIFGSDDGHLYQVLDDGITLTAGWTPIDVGSPVGVASPAIGPDGTIYIGTQGGRVFAIGPQ